VPALSQRGRLRAAAVTLTAALGATALGGVARADTTATSSTTSSSTSSSSTTSSSVTTVGPAAMGIATGRTTTTPGSPILAWVRLVAPGGLTVPGAAVTFWKATPAHPYLAVPTAHGVTGADGIAKAPITLRVTEYVWATANYPTTRLANGWRLAAGSVKSGRDVLVRVGQPLATAVLRLAAALRGRPYVYGASGPGSFDCSGYTRYVMAHAAGKALPHSAESQYVDSVHVSPSAARPGDLVFFMSGGYAYHVGIYAGSGLIWHAPHPGTGVQLSRIATSSWAVGRVL
jgi:cell wall-associated NlpC family hydrolase